MSGATAYGIWQQALAATEPLVAGARGGSAASFEKLCGAVAVLLALKLALVEAVTTREDGVLGMISGDLAALQKESFVIREQGEDSVALPQEGERGRP